MAAGLPVCARVHTVSALICVGQRVRHHNTAEATPPLHTNYPSIHGVVSVQNERGRFLGQTLYSPHSQIRLRLLEPSDRPVAPAWWEERLGRAAALRREIDSTAYRVLHGEGDGLPSLIVHRYDRWLVVQLLSAGLETMRATILDALVRVLRPDGILLRNDASVRRHEALAETVELVYGNVPQEIEIKESGVRYFAAPWTGQKTRAFLDQRPNRIRAGELAAPWGRALDCFAYNGSFALHLACRSANVMALDTSSDALMRGARNAELNGLSNVLLPCSESRISGEHCSSRAGQRAVAHRGGAPGPRGGPS